VDQKRKVLCKVDQNLVLRTVDLITVL